MQDDIKEHIKSHSSGGSETACPALSLVAVWVYMWDFLGEEEFTFELTVES